MGKRKADEAGLPHAIRQEPAPSGGTGPFVVYFPSRFEPDGDVACEWQAYAHQRKNQFTVVARTVSEGSVNSGAAGQASRSPVRSAAAAATARHLPASPLLSLQKNQVDFVGSTSSAEYSTQLPCRCVLLLIGCSHGHHQSCPYCLPAS